MATVTRGTTYGSTETITNAKLHILVDDATVTGIVNADISAGAAIAASKLNLTSSGYVTTGADNSFTGDNSFSGAVTLATATDENGHSGGFIPAGCILLWSGAVSAIPTGWVICDGTNSTPDLTDRFVIHADADSGGTNNVDATGGAHTKNLLHAHTFTAAWASSATGRDPEELVVGRTGQNKISNAYKPSGNKTTNSSGSATQDIMPKYYALAYIMKS